MADATIVIRDLGQQIAQLVVDRTILAAELAAANARIAELEAPEGAEFVGEGERGA